MQSILARHGTFFMFFDWVKLSERNRKIESLQAVHFTLVENHSFFVGYKHKHDNDLWSILKYSVYICRDWADRMFDEILYAHKKPDVLASFGKVLSFFFRSDHCSHWYVANNDVHKRPLECSFKQIKDPTILTIRIAAFFIQQCWINTVMKRYN